LATLIATVRRGSRARNLRLLGTRHEVLVEKQAKRGEALQARTRDFKTVLLPPGDAAIGGYYTVRLTGTTGSTFTGAVELHGEQHTQRRLPVTDVLAAAG
jgi:tRNA-2-methylthio-N6-dimethylallyladenosine synthase